MTPVRGTTVVRHRCRDRSVPAGSATGQSDAPAVVCMGDLGLADPRIEDRYHAAVGTAAYQSSDALLQRDYRLRNAVVGERSAPVLIDEPRPRRENDRVTAGSKRTATVR